MEVNYYELGRMSPKDRERLCRRTGVDIKELMVRVAPILEDVRKRGNDAVLEYTRQFDGAEIQPEDFRMSDGEMDRAVEKLPHDLKEAMEVSIANIRKFHERQVEPPSWEMEISPGIIAGERIVPIPSVGLYVPRGKGSFPSMMMMSGVPAKVAGVERIAVITPPDRKGKADPATMAAARMIGINEVYALGGVQAVAALAFGTQTIPKVDKIVGPGSGYVLAAKQILSTEIDTGLPAGPSEAIILADDSADAIMAVTDLLIEAEHGPDSSAYLVTTDASLASKALELIPRMVAALPEERASFCSEVFRTNGGVILASDMDDAVDFINQFAPEHLQILTREPSAVSGKG